MNRARIVAVVVSICVLGVVACTRAQVQQGAEDARKAVNAYCDARAQALHDLAGEAGAP